MPDMPVSALRLMIEQVTACTDATVDVVSASDDVDRYPLVVVQVAALRGIDNGESHQAVNFRCVLSTISATRDVALSIAERLYANLVKAWKAGHVTQHGWISHITTVSLPTLVANGGVGDDTWRFDTALNITARH